MLDNLRYQMSATARAIVNFVMFQIAWVLMVYGASVGNCWIGLAWLPVFAFAQLRISPEAATELRVMVLAVFVGLAVESAVVASGLVTYACADYTLFGAPLWIVGLWAAFALTTNGCLGWLQGRPWLAAAVGGFGGPLSYYTGMQLGAATPEQSMPFVLFVNGLIFAVATPFLVETTRRSIRNLRYASTA